MDVKLSFQATGSIPGNAGPVPMRGASLTIGRGEENDLTLPDPDHTISRRHCVIERKGETVVVVDLSSNGTFLNYAKSPLGKREAPLNNGDILSIGKYELVVSIAEQGTRDPLADIPPPAEDPSVMAERGRPVDDLLAPLDGKGEEGDFLDELLSGPADRNTSRNLFPETEEGVLPPLGEEDDPIFPADRPDPQEGTGASYGETGHAHSDHFSPPRSARMIIPEDFDEEIGVSGPGPEPEEAPREETATGGEDAREAELPSRPDPDRETAPAPRAAPPGASAEAAEAFLAALGLSPDEIPDGERAEVMERLGGVLRTMIVGLRELLMTRAAFKSEFPIDRTMIRATGNNPLKFSVSEEQAIRAMARKTDKGYLDAAAAAEEALGDIRAHEIAMVTGMQAAMKSVLQKLDPALLEERMGQDRSLVSFFQGQKSRYWEAYKAKYGEIAEQAEEDFEEFFGKEFARAYLEQLKKI